jgi:sulfite exporter TauE/SafE
VLVALSSDISYVTAFAVALLGGVHCVGMCGGIVGALTLGVSPRAKTGGGAIFPYLLAYNFGRILSYTVAGALVGGVSAMAGELTTLYQGQRVLLIVAALFMVALGLYIAGWWQGLMRIEKLGARYLWRHLQPLGQRFLPVRSPRGAFALGLIWGWLPCGLVYSVLIWTIGAGSALKGALLMLSFGLGTLPTLLAMGAFAATLSAFVRRPLTRKIAGTIIVLFGVYYLAGAVRLIDGGG